MMRMIGVLALIFALSCAALAQSDEELLRAIVGKYFDAYARKDLQASAGYLAQGLKVLPPEAEAVRPEYELNLAVVSQQLGLFDQAAELYQKAIQRSPLRADLWTALGDMHMQMRRFGEARLDYEHALQVSPGNQGLLERLSRAKSSLN